MPHSRDELSTGKTHQLHVQKLEDIEVQLLDEKGNPEKGRARLTLPDGTVVEKDLDRHGKIGARKVLPGPCRLEFPVPNGRDPAIATGAIDITVLDDDDEALGGANYKITFADGSTKEGVTAEDGRIKLRDVPRGEYTLELVGEDGTLTNVDDDDDDDEDDDDVADDPGEKD
jgi:hypothetical protein